MKILVDADACPKPIKEILFRAANRLQINMILFANHPLTIPGSKFIQFKQVPKGFDVADNVIENMLDIGDLVITADIPLASNVIDKNAIALNPRGTLYTKDNIKEKLRMRNLMSELREFNQISSGPAPLSKKDLHNFANALDAFLAKQ